MRSSMLRLKYPNLMVIAVKDRSEPWIIPQPVQQERLHIPLLLFAPMPWNVNKEHKNLEYSAVHTFFTKIVELINNYLHIYVHALWSGWTRDLQYI
jgi:hypothetical protein